MCGIFLYLVKNGKYSTKSSERPNMDSIDNLLSNRGPDAKDQLKLKLYDWNAHFVGHVLQTQGQSICKQPLAIDNSHIMLWNGDVFNDSYVAENECDSVEVFKNIIRDGVLQTISDLTGPYAFIYYDGEEKCIWLGRDVIGRHSLLWSITSEYVVITSVAEAIGDLKFTEIPSKGIFKLDLISPSLVIDFYPWSHSILTCQQFNLEVPIRTKTPLRHFLIDSFVHKDPNPCLNYLKAFNECRNNIDAFFVNLLGQSDVLDRVETFTNILSKSVKVRTEKQPEFCKLCIFSRKKCSHSKLGILFSGGLDSTVLAILADKFVPPENSIDLFNVAFENPTKNTKNYSVPDRKTGLASLKELERLCPKRIWNFVKIDVTHAELTEKRLSHISNLIYPLDTVLDDSLGCAVWFAARGAGTLLRTDQPYTSPTRVVLLGMGVDELLGGYMRYRTEWRRSQCWEALGDSLTADLARIGHRNLGRDNRMVSDHGRQPRTPYLDEHLVAFILSLHPSKRCNLSDTLPVGVGDKLLLRLVAWKLGLRNCATLPKRAMQFGSRIANSKEKGDHVSHRL